MADVPADLYDSFGVDLVLSGIETLAARRS
jgi:hypothetical protein